MKLTKHFIISIGIILVLIGTIRCIFPMNFFLSITELAIAIVTMIIFTIIARRKKNEWVYRTAPILIVGISGSVLAVLCSKIPILTQRIDGILFLFFIGFAIFMALRLSKKPSFS